MAIVSCPNCNKEIDLNQANFCGSCGADISFYRVSEQQFYDQQFQQHQFHQPQQYQHQFYQSHEQQIQQQQFQFYQNEYYQRLQSDLEIEEYYNKKDRQHKIFINICLTMLILSSIFIFISENFQNLDTSKLYGVDDSLFYNFFSGESTNEPTEYYFAGGISSLEFDKLSTGMSYALASSIIGGDGDLVNSGENIHKKIYYTYRWVSEYDEDLIYYITFVEDEISEIMQDYAL